MASHYLVSRSLSPRRSDPIVQFAKPRSKSEGNHPSQSQVVADAVTVGVRVRDFTGGEKAQTALQMKDNQCSLIVPDKGYFPFAFDHCFWSIKDIPCDVPFSSQTDVFTTLGKPLVDNALFGFNASLIAYGPTGSGKTYSLFGPPQQRYSTGGDGGENDRRQAPMNDTGLVPRSLQYLFEAMKDMGGNEIKVSISAVEIYLDHVFDLLTYRKSCHIRAEGQGHFAVQGMATYPVACFEDAMYYLQQADESKTTLATAIHADSSRAHTIVEVLIYQTVTGPDRQPRTKRSKMVFADLAGSEQVKVAKTDYGIGFEQAKSINLSLLSLGTCIEAVVKASKSGDPFRNIPQFRDCALTKVLKDCIGGNSKTSVLATLSPGLANANNTLHALRFANRAKSLKTRANLGDFVSDDINIDQSYSEFRDLAMHMDARNAVRGKLLQQQIEFSFKVLNFRVKQLEKLEARHRTQVLQEMKSSSCVMQRQEAKSYMKARLAERAADGRTPRKSAMQSPLTSPRRLDINEISQSNVEQSPQASSLLTPRPPREQKQKHLQRRKAGSSSASPPSPKKSEAAPVERQSPVDLPTPPPKELQRKAPPPLTDLLPKAPAAKPATKAAAAKAPAKSSSKSKSPSKSKLEKLAMVEMDRRTEVRKEEIIQWALVLGTIARGKLMMANEKTTEKVAPVKIKSAKKPADKAAPIAAQVKAKRELLALDMEEHGKRTDIFNEYVFWYTRSLKEVPKPARPQKEASKAKAPAPPATKRVVPTKPAAPKSTVQQKGKVPHPPGKKAPAKNAVGKKAAAVPPIVVRAPSAGSTDSLRSFGSVDSRDSRWSWDSRIEKYITSTKYKKVIDETRKHQAEERKKQSEVDTIQETNEAVPSILVPQSRPDDVVESVDEPVGSVNSPREPEPSKEEVAASGASDVKAENGGEVMEEEEVPSEPLETKPTTVVAVSSQEPLETKEGGEKAPTVVPEAEKVVAPQPTQEPVTEAKEAKTEVVSIPGQESVVSLDSSTNDQPPVLPATSEVPKELPKIASSSPWVEQQKAGWEKLTTIQQLQLYYVIYAPEKPVSDMELAANKYKGDIPTMWKKLEKKYGPVFKVFEKNTAIDDQLKGLPAPAEVTAPEKSPVTVEPAKEDESTAPKPEKAEVVAPVDKVPEQEPVKEATEKVVAPQPTQEPVTEAKEAKTEVVSIPGQESVVSLDSSTNTAPATSEVVKELPTIAPSSSWFDQQKAAWEKLTTVQQLQLYYVIYAPEKPVSDMELAANKYKGDIPTMWKKLEKKYGPVFKVFEKNTAIDDQLKGLPVAAAPVEAVPKRRLQAKPLFPVEEPSKPTAQPEVTPAPQPTASETPADSVTKPGDASATSAISKAPTEGSTEARPSIEVVPSTTAPTGTPQPLVSVMPPTPSQPSAEPPENSNSCSSNTAVPVTVTEGVPAPEQSGPKEDVPPWLLDL